MFYLTRRKTRKKVVFIIDDDYSTAFLINYRLNNLAKVNLETYIFSSVEKALKDISIKPDIIILDHYLKNTSSLKGSNVLNGIDSLPLILKHHSKVSIAIISSQSDTSLISKAYKFGAKSYLEKNSTVTQRAVTFVEEEIELKRKKNLGFLNYSKRN